MIKSVSTLVFWTVGLCSLLLSACGGGGEPADTLAPITLASPAGGTYQVAQSVRLTCDDGAGSGCVATYYTLDGSAPTSASSTFASDIPITQDTTLRFFSVDEAGNQEAVRTESYVISPQNTDTDPPVTTVSPAGGTYQATQSVSLTCDDGAGSGCAATHYTTDGTVPTLNSPVYAAPLEIAADTQLRFFSVDQAGNRENVQTEAYTIESVQDVTPPVTTAAPAGGTYPAAQSVSLTCDDAGGSGCAGTYYTLDGSDPTVASPAYAGPIAIDADAQLRFFSVDQAGNQEVVQTEDYVIEIFVNTPPVADAGADQQVAVGALVQLDGTGSSDADGDALTYGWAMPIVPAGSAAALDDPASPTPSFTADVAGTYRILLTVYDAEAGSQADEVIITAIAHPQARVFPPSGSPIGRVNGIEVYFDQSMDPATLVLGGDLQSSSLIWSSISVPNDFVEIYPDTQWSEGWSRSLTIDALGENGVPLAGQSLVYDVLAYHELPYLYVDGQAGDDGNDGLTPPAPKLTITAAIQSAPVPAAVLVAGGDYWVSSDPADGTQVTLREGVSLYGGYAADFASRDAAQTLTRIMDESTAVGVNNAALVGLDGSGLTPATVVDGFQILAGGGQYCAAVWLYNASPSLRHNDLRGGSDCDYSYGAYFSLGASPWLVDNRIYGGQSRQETTAVAAEYSQMLLERNTLDGGSGGHRAWGVASWSSGGVTLRNNTIHAGTADMATWGLVLTGLAQVSSNTVDGGQGPAATAIACSGSEAVIENNILFTSGGTTRVCFLEIFGAGNPASFRNNDLFDCPTALYADHVSGGGDCPFSADNNCLLDIAAVNALQDMSIGSRGNVSLDPAFADPGSRDWHLTPASPFDVRDGALNLSAEFGDDRDGLIRLAPWSMGAYEEARTYLYVDDLAGDDGNDGLTPSAPKRTIPAAIEAAPIPAAVLVAGGIYLVNSDPAVATDVVLKEGVSLYGGFAADFASQDIYLHPTRIFDQSTATGVNNAAVVAPNGSGVTPATAVYGFRIRGGGGTVCAAVRLDNASPTLLYNVISGGSGCDNSYGVHLSNGSAARIQDNGIAGGQASQRTEAVFAENSQMILERNSINGGSSDFMAFGVDIWSSVGDVVRNNLIRAGSGASYSYGIVTEGPVQVSNNTIDGGDAPRSVAMNYHSGEALIENNILFTTGGNTRLCFREEPVGSLPAALHNNDLFDCPDALYVHYVGGSGDCPFDDQSDCLLDAAAVNALAGMSDGSSGNLSLDPIFADRAAGDWHLTPASPVEIRQGGLDLSTDFTDDAWGLPRSVPWSIGADEQD